MEEEATEGIVSLLNARTSMRETRSFPKAQPKEISFAERWNGSPGVSPVIDKAKPYRGDEVWDLKEGTKRQRSGVLEVTDGGNPAESGGPKGQSEGVEDGNAEGGLFAIPRGTDSRILQTLKESTAARISRRKSRGEQAAWRPEASAVNPFYCRPTPTWRNAGDVLRTPLKELLNIIRIVCEAKTCGGVGVPTSSYTIPMGLC